MINKHLDLEPIGATEAKTHFGNLLHQASVNKKKFLINRQGKAVAVMIGYNSFCKLIEKINKE